MKNLRKALTLQFVVNAKVTLVEGQQNYNFNEKQMADFIDGVVENYVALDSVTGRLRTCQTGCNGIVINNICNNCGAKW
jgi:hypothetical protein